MVWHPLGIRIEAAGKRYGRQWVLRHRNWEVLPGTTVALLGANGSGKSSLLRLMCGFDAPTEGEVKWTSNGQSLDAMEVPLTLTYCAPDQSLMPDLTVDEHLDLHFRLRDALPEMNADNARNLALLSTKGNVRIRELSSGMRQRLSLTLAFATTSSAIFLDEPCSHLDQAGRTWYRELVLQWRLDRTLVVASNHDEQEYPGVTSRMDLSL